MPLDDRRAQPVTVDTLTHPEELFTLGDEWDGLWRRSDVATPFQTSAWAQAWWRHFGSGALALMAVRASDGRLVGVAPLYVHTVDGVRTLRLIGAGISDYLDLVAEPGWDGIVADAVLRELQARREGWDAVEFQQLPTWSALLDPRWSGAAAMGMVAGVPCPVLELGAQEPGSDRLRENMAADRRRLERDVGPVAFETADAATVRRLFAELERLHAARWSARGEGGVMADADALAFHRDAVQAQFGYGIVRVTVLRGGGRALGAYYGFVHRRRAYYYLCGFDPAYRRYGVGNLLAAHGIAEARREGAGTFDFLRGQESYKYRWGARDTPTHTRRISGEPQPRSRDQDVFATRVGSHGPTVRSAA